MFLLGFRVLINGSGQFFDMMVVISRVGEVHAHQHLR